MKPAEFIIVIPTYNNPLTIKNVAADVLAHNYNIIIVDDGSDIDIESLFETEDKKNITFVRHSENKGKGEAIISGAV